jgi:hypothetical protein
MSITLLGNENNGEKTKAQNDQRDDKHQAEQGRH